MTAQLDVLGVADVLASIEGLSLPVAACILAEIGDPGRFGSSRALVKHAGVAPCDNSSGTPPGRPGSPAAAAPCCARPPGGAPGR